MQREEKHEPMRMILCGHDSVFRSSCGPADFLAACEQLGLLQCREKSEGEAAQANHFSEKTATQRQRRGHFRQEVARKRSWVRINTKLNCHRLQTGRRMSASAFQSSA